MSDDKDVRILAPDYSLKKKVGAAIPLDQILNEKVLQKAEKAITRSASELLVEVKDDLLRLKQEVKLLIPAIEPAQHFAKCLELSFHIKSLAGMCGFDFATDVAKSLYNFCEHCVVQNIFSDKHKQVVAAHVDVISLVFQENIKGKGEAREKLLLKELETTIAKLLSQPAA